MRREPGKSDAYELAEPNPAALVEALRAFGYTAEAAIADLIDNSISAGARNIWLTFFWAGADSYVSVRDDGHGMTQAGLLNAMRPGSQHPSEERAATDLGRFGLGLKTASFSQCRRLTVSSKKSSGTHHTRRWDLDYVLATSEWRLLKGPATGSEDRLRIKETSAGTIVLWEVLDRIVEDFEEENVPAKKRFLQMAESIEKHVGMVFHRFLTRPRELRIWVGGRRIEPWDPFLSNEAATQQLSSEKLHIHQNVLTVTPFILPHHSKIDADTHSRTSGVRGWNAHQGFYIYRNKRLLVAGDWLNLGFHKEEHYKLARIMVDIPSSMDSEWHIDVKKSRARPPGGLRDDFLRIARATRERAVEVYRHRGKIIARTAARNYVFVWNQRVKHGKVSYRINPEHPLVRQVLSLPKETARLARALIKLVEETVPVPLIIVDAAERPDAQSIPFQDSPTKDVSLVLFEVYRALRSSGLSRNQAKQRLITMEPFQHYPELIEALDEVELEDGT